MLTKIFLLIWENLFLPYKDSILGGAGFTLLYAYIVIPVLFLFTLFLLVRLLMRHDAKCKLFVWAYVVCLILLGGIFILSTFWWFDLLFLSWWGCFALVLFLYASAPALRHANWQKDFFKRLPILILCGADLIWMTVSACVCKIAYSGDYFRYVQADLVKTISHYDLQVFVLFVNLIVVVLTILSVKRYNEKYAYDN